MTISQLTVEQLIFDVEHRARVKDLSRHDKIRLIKAVMVDEDDLDEFTLLFETMCDVRGFKL